MVNSFNNTVEVVYALEKYQHIFTVNLSDFSDPTRVTILEVVNQSGILEYYTEINLDKNKVGIYSQIKNLSDYVKPLDRIEIYRDLIIEPMEARRLRAAKKKLR